MENSSYWLLFLSAAFAIDIAPGPDMIYIISKTIAQGRKIGFASSLGVCAGALVHISAAALGLSAILATSALAFSVVKFAGAGYLVYLGIQALLSKGETFDNIADDQSVSTPWETFKQGALIDVLNPKVAIFFMAFLPQFIRPGMGSTPFQIIELGIIVILMAIVVEFTIVLLAAQATELFRKNRKLSVWLDRILGTVLIGLAARLLFSENPAH